MQVVKKIISNFNKPNKEKTQDKKTSLTLKDKAKSKKISKK